MKKLLPFFLFCAVHAWGKEIELKTTITDVTVFQSGAQVNRSGSITIPAGEYDVVVRDATALLKKESIQVKSDGNFTVLSVNYQVNLNDQQPDKAGWAALEAKEKDLKRRMEDLSVKIEVLRTEQQVVNNLQGVSTSSEGVTVEQVAKAQELLKTRLLSVKSELLSASRQMNDLNDEHQETLQQLSVLKTPKQKVSYEIVLRVLAKAETKGSFSISYIVPNARWFPTYDLRVKSVSDPMTIDYKANVTQQTGEDWNNVKLKLSTGDPSLTSDKPKIETWWLYLNQSYVQPRQQTNYYRYTDAKFTKVRGRVIDKSTGAPLIGASVMVDATNIGAATDVDGRFDLVLPENAKNIRVNYIGYSQQLLPITGEEMTVYMEEMENTLSEVMVMTDKTDADEFIAQDLQHMPGVVNTRGKKSEAAAVTATPSLNIVSTEFSVNERYSIASDPKNVIVAIQSISSDASYLYYCAPRLDKDVFLTAQLTNWEKYNLLEGQANVFFEGTFIGSTLLDTRYLSDTLEISLGRDKSVKVERKKSNEFNRHTFFGNDNIAYRDWDIAVRNGKQQPIDIIVEDQFPLAADSKIEIKQEEKSGGMLNEKTGVVTWRYKMDPASSKAMQLKYTARYPKGSFIGLD